MSQVSFEEVVMAWLLDYDGRLPSNDRERKESFLVLLGNLETYGYKKEDLTTNKKEKIVRTCVNPNHRNKKKLSIWISIVVSDLEKAILIYYGSVKINRDVITSEMSAKLDGLDKKAEETRALRLVSNQPEDESDGDNFDSAKATLDEPLNIEDAIKNAVNNPSPKLPETFEITDEMLKDIPAPNILWDEDFMKKLESEDE